MSAQRFSLRAAVTDKVSTGRRKTVTSPTEPEPEPAPTPLAPAPARATPKTKRSTTREGARGITVWVEPEVYRMVKLVALDADMTTQDVMMEAINDLLAKKGKGRIAKTGR